MQVAPLRCLIATMNAAFRASDNFSKLSDTLFAGLSDFSDNRSASCPYFLCGGVFLVINA